jgi:hypothetical protein
VLRAFVTIVGLDFWAISFPNPNLINIIQSE